ncbi:MAG: F0F1 ATP synthase subunit B [Dehalococcoidales bacterium]|nr:F0F1 ATP synthase subunit B [Dehalococcoidales bacterium]
MEGLTKLGISLPTLIAQVIQFSILLGLMYLFAYKPIMRMLDERARKVKETADHAEAMKQKASMVDQEIEKQLAMAGAQGQERIERATRIAEEMRQKARDEAKKEAETLLNRARSEIQQERDEAIGELRQEFAELTILAAEKVIDKTLDREGHRELIEKVLTQGLTEKKN